MSITTISSRDDLKDYCLRRLGAPVIEINVDDDQVEDRIQDAIEFMQEYHYDATERTYIKLQITASTILLTTSDALSFKQSEIITGLTSGATAQVYAGLAPSTLQLTGGQTNGTFVDGEIITGNLSGVSKVIAPNGFFLGNWDKQYFALPDNVTGVSRIFILGPGTAGVNTRNIFDVVYQFRLNDMYDLMSTDLIYYTQVKMHLSMLDMLLPGERSIRFNRNQEKLMIDMNWSEQFIPGSFVIAEAYMLVDPEQYIKFYNDYFLKKYATALIKRQWGANLGKFDGIQLPGGVTLNGDKIFKDAMDEITALEAEMNETWREPIDFMVG